MYVGVLPEVFPWDVVVFPGVVVAFVVLAFGVVDEGRGVVEEGTTAGGGATGGTPGGETVSPGFSAPGSSSMITGGILTPVSMVVIVPLPSGWFGSKDMISETPVVAPLAARVSRK